MWLSHINHQPKLFQIITDCENNFFIKNKTPHITVLCALERILSY